ncbi:MAG TPA: ABC transporter permease [Bryobacterales bacterium]|nr:ABC transporter permease [Bryobacterales bacterium]
MIAGFRDVRVSAAEAERRIDVAATIQNCGRETWRPAAGFALGYQIYDPVTGALVEDGRRTALDRDIAPGESVSLQLSVPLPPEEGRCRIYVAPLQENVAWFWDKGSPFLLIDAQIENRALRLSRQLIATLARVRLERLFRTFGRALWYPWRTISQHGSLIRSMVRRDIAGRYRGSYAGLFWTVIHPLLMMITYYFVFGIVLHTRFGNDARPSSFVLYFLAGMLPWLAFSEAVGRSPSIILEYRTFVKKLVFPVEILPVNLALAGLVSELFGALIFAAGLWYFGHPFPATMLYLPALLLPQLLLTLGLCWFLAALGVFFRDAGQLIGFLLTLWFFVTPICYPEASLPQGWLWLFSQNPLYILVRAYRMIFLESAAPDWPALAKLTACSALIFFAGHAWFYKLRRSFADLL